MDNLFHFRLKGTSKAFYAADISHASRTQIQRLIADVFSISPTSFALREVRSTKPPVVYGGQFRAQDINSGLLGYYEVEVGKRAYVMNAYFEWNPLISLSLSLSLSLISLSRADIGAKIAQVLLPLTAVATILGIGVIAFFQSQKKKKLEHSH